MARDKREQIAEPKIVHLPEIGDRLFRAIRACGITLEFQENANTILVNGKEFTAGEFCEAFPFTGWSDPSKTDWKTKLETFEAERNRQHRAEGRR